MRRFLTYSLFALLAVVAFLTAAVAYVLSWPEFGGRLEGDRLRRAMHSPQYTGERFENDPPPPGYDILVTLREMMGDQVRVPPSPFPMAKPSFTPDVAPGLRAYWFGHAAVLIEIDGYRVMSDPMLSRYAFPVQMVAPERFNPPPLPLHDLPRIDAVVISHDHYDHLDMKTIRHLAAQGTHFYVGIGIGAHLEVWDVPATQIHEMDWWESLQLGDLTIHCTPARHYSGRRAPTNPTLWASWVVQGPQHRVYHSGDTGYAPHFTSIADRLGPLDVAFVKIGDYGNGAAWESIHMRPEDAVQAHVDLGAEVLFPIHWGTFELSYHDWNEPIERAMKAAEEAGITLVTPRLGEPYAFGEPRENEPWWRDL